MKARPKPIGSVRFRKVGGRYLLTNETGQWTWLDPTDFRAYMGGRNGSEFPLARDLEKRGFGPLQEADGEQVHRLRQKYAFAMAGPSLHIIIPTLRCNLSCAYCHASSQDVWRKDLDLSVATAKRIVDVIFSTPNPFLAIEFQGGEPLANWDVVRFIIEYAQEKNRIEKRSLIITLVSNLLLLTPDKLDFLIDRKVSLCTSLDGPAGIHDAHRGRSHAVVVQKLKQAVEKYRTRFDRYMPSALPTVTRRTLPHAKALVDEYVGLGLEGVHLRPLNPLGFARNQMEVLDVTPEEFLAFYREALDHILDLNIRGTFFMERLAWIFLVKILTDSDPNFLDIRSPCGAGIGQMAYNYNGNVYTCDEGRMMSMQGDESFRMGNVDTESYEEMIRSEAVRTLCVASCLDGLPGCWECAYKPYCGVCPVVNYAMFGTITPPTYRNPRCGIHMGILDTLFELIQDPKKEAVFRRWVDREVGVFE